MKILYCISVGFFCFLGMFNAYLSESMTHSVDYFMDKTYLPVSLTLLVEDYGRATSRSVFSLGIVSISVIFYFYPDFNREYITREFHTPIISLC